MTLFGVYFVSIAATVLVVAILLFWSLRRRTKSRKGEVRSLEPVEVPGGHVIYLPQMGQALQKMDFEFLAARGTSRLMRQVKRERRQILLCYLEAVHGDFARLLRMARVIAVLSPEIAPAQEWERLRLSVWFALNYRMLRLRIGIGLASEPQLDGLSRSVGNLATQIEQAMTQLGERAAFAHELSSSLNS
jgi:hypothetical protein